MSARPFGSWRSTPRGAVGVIDRGDQAEVCVSRSMATRDEYGIRLSWEEAEALADALADAIAARTKGGAR